MWTEEEKGVLLSLYPEHSDAEICSILGKTPGQLRGMKERLGLRAKSNPLKESEKAAIREYYMLNNGALDLQPLSEKINRNPQVISRYARSIGLTNNSRPLTDACLLKQKEARDAFHNTERYKSVILPRSMELLRYYARNKHPRGMLGKNHSIETKDQMSATHKRLWKEMTPEDRAELISKMRSTHIAEGKYRSTRNTYSRCKGGFRKDIGIYVRSSWEANTARLLNHLGLSWEYEPKRFFFPDEKDGVLSYCPDFYLSDLGLWIEVKGWMDNKSALRLWKMKQYHPAVFENLILISEPLYKRISEDFSPFIDGWEDRHSISNL